MHQALQEKGSGSHAPLWISFTLDDHAVALRSGETVADAVRVAVHDLGAAAVLFNCSRAEVIGRAIAEAGPLLPAGTGLGGYANRFEPGAEDDEPRAANEGLSTLRDDLTPDRYAELVSGWIRDGATIVGGCCGITPEHIAALAARLALR